MRWPPCMQNFIRPVKILKSGHDQHIKVLIMFYKRLREIAQSRERMKSPALF